MILMDYLFAKYWLYLSFNINVTTLNVQRLKRKQFKDKEYNFDHVDKNIICIYY